MGQSLTHLLVHSTFSTKDRRPLLRSEEIRNEIHAYIKASQRVGRPFRARRLMSLHPGLKHPTSHSLRRGCLFGVTYHNMRAAIA